MGGNWEVRHGGCGEDHGSESAWTANHARTVIMNGLSWSGTAGEAGK